jgi:hypothetical protein
MYSMQCYKDLCSEISISQIRIEGLEGQKKELMKLLGGPTEISCQQYSEMPIGSKNAMSIDRIFEALNKIESILEIENGLLKGMVDTQIKINVKLKGLEGLQYKIMYKREIENKTIIRIAQELNYGVRKIYRELEKMA